MHSVCEISSKYVLPIFRSKVVEILINEKGMNQVEVAELLDISQATVSLYLGKKRGSSKRFSSLLDSDVINNYARSFSEEIAKSHSYYKSMEYFCVLCQELRRRGLLCGAHRELVNVPEACNVCIK
jgi:hypothetical protein